MHWKVMTECENSIDEMIAHSLINLLFFVPVTYDKKKRICSLDQLLHFSQKFS